MGHAKRIWYLSPMRAAKVQASLRIRAVSPEPSLLAHTSSESRGTFRQKARSVAPLNGWACAVEICHDGMLEDTNSLGGAQIRISNGRLGQEKKKKKKKKKKRTQNETSRHFLTSDIGCHCFSLFRTVNGDKSVAPFWVTKRLGAFLFYIIPGGKETVSYRVVHADIPLPPFIGITIVWNITKLEPVVVKKLCRQHMLAPNYSPTYVCL